MTDLGHQHPSVPARPRRRPSLYRTVLSIAVAGLVAAWLPFSLFYINALSKHRTAPVATVAAAKPTAAASGAQTATAPAAVTAPAPVTTRVS